MIWNAVRACTLGSSGAPLTENFLDRRLSANFNTLIRSGARPGINPATCRISLMSTVQPCGFCGATSSNATRLRRKTVFIVVLKYSPKPNNWISHGLYCIHLKGACMFGKCCLVLAAMLAFAHQGAGQYNQGDVELG